MPGLIRNPSEFSSDQTIETDIVIVGAGPAGGAAAFKLASLGKKVVLLESGGYFNTGDFSRDGLKALKNLYQDAGQRFTSGNAYFATMFGKGVGGGSLVNSGISFNPPDKAIQAWESEAKLLEFTPAKLKPYVEEVQKHVHIETLDISRLGRNNTIFKEGLDKLGYRGGVIPRNTLDCHGCGICFYGCPSGAKQSVDKNFIAEAVKLGVDVYTHTKVVRLDIDSKSQKFESLMAKIEDSKTGELKARLTVNAKHIVLAAGAIGSPQILVKNRIGNSSGHVGKNFHCHPSSGVLGVFSEEIKGFHSVMQGYFSDHFFDEELLIETYWAPTGIIAGVIPSFGREAADIMMKNIKNMAGAGAMIRDESSGEVTFDDEKIEIKYVVTERDQKLLTRGLFRSAEVLLAAGAHTIYADSPKKTKFTSLEELRSYFAKVDNLGTDIIREGNHGMGTCRMGEDPKTSVVNSFGKSHDINNLWILDVSTFPRALGVNPQITVMALALRGAEYLNAHFS